MLGDAVEVIVDAGPLGRGRSLDDRRRTGREGRILRRGALSLDDLNAALESLGRRASRTTARGA